MKRKALTMFGLMVALVVWEMLYAIFAVAPASAHNRHNGERGASMTARLARGLVAVRRLPTVWLLEPLLDLASVAGLDCAPGPSATSVRHVCRPAEGYGGGKVCPPGARIPGRAAICGLTRNNRWELPRMRGLIESLGCLFEGYEVILVENDSNDGTKQYLRRWARQDRHVRLLSQNYHLQKRPSHGFLADLRNKYVELVMEGWVEAGGERQPFEYMLALDMDLLDIDIDSVRRMFPEANGAASLVMPGAEYTSLGGMHDWAMIGANGMTRNGRYYDVFALRTNEVKYDPEVGIDQGVGESETVCL
jgi:hypothetical protein